MPAQETRVYQGVRGNVAETMCASLRERLPPEAEWRNVPHARFSVKWRDVVLTCFDSGKLLLQGRDLDGFLAFALPDFDGAAVAEAAAATLPLTSITLGSDETGKGDYFGPLVVAAACVRPDQEARLRQAGVADSKQLSDDRVRILAGLLEREVPHEFSQLPPELYNRAYARAKSLNRLLADMHARALSRLRARCSAAEAIVVDQFARAELLRDALARECPGHPPLTQWTRGERHVAVAAASILARARFLDGLRESSDACGVDLPKGAGDPVDAAGRKVLAVGGRELLAKVAKLHFKNTKKLEG